MYLADAVLIDGNGCLLSNKMPSRVLDYLDWPRKGEGEGGGEELSNSHRKKRKWPGLRSLSKFFVEIFFQ